MIIASVSGGLASGEMLRRLVAQHGAQNVTAIFADVKGDPRSHAKFSPFPALDVLLHERFGGESRGLYRFLWQLSHALDVPIIRLQQFKTSFAHMADAKAFKIPNPSGVDFLPCSLNGKREVIAAWIDEHVAPGEFTMALGFDWSEVTRRNPVEYWWKRRLPRHTVRFAYPLLNKPYTDTADMLAHWRAAGVVPSDSYDLKYEHDNCDGMCVGGGIGQCVLTRRVRPGVFHYWRYMERVLQVYIGTNATILKDQRAATKAKNEGKAGKLSLETLNSEIVAGTAPAQWMKSKQQAGCACFSLPGFEGVEVAKPRPRRKRTITNVAESAVGVTP